MDSRPIFNAVNSSIRYQVLVVLFSFLISPNIYAQNKAENSEKPAQAENGAEESEGESKKQDSNSDTLKILKQKNCLFLVTTQKPLKTGYSYAITLPDASEMQAVVRKAVQNKAQLLALPKNKKCPASEGKSLTIDLSTGKKAEGPSAQAESSGSGKNKKKGDSATQEKSASENAPNAAASAPRQKQYRIDAGGGYLMFFQKIDASNPFILAAKKESVTSIGGISYYGGVQASFPLSNGNTLLLGGRYQMYSGSKEIELGGGSPSFKYSLKITELVLKPGYSFSNCFGLGFNCALMGVVAKSNSADVRLGAVAEPPISDLAYLRFGGGALLQKAITDGFDGFFEIEASTSSGTLKRGDTERKFEISPQFFVFTGGINFSL